MPATRSFTLATTSDARRRFRRLTAPTEGAHSGFGVRRDAYDAPRPQGHSQGIAPPTAAAAQNTTATTREIRAQEVILKKYIKMQLENYFVSLQKSLLCCRGFFEGLNVLSARYTPSVRSFLRLNGSTREQSICTVYQRRRPLLIR